MPDRGTIDAVFIMIRMQVEYHVKEKKLYMCFVHLEDRQRTEESVGMGNEEERNTTSFA